MRARQRIIFVAYRNPQSHIASPVLNTPPLAPFYTLFVFLTQDGWVGVFNRVAVRDGVLLNRRSGCLIPGRRTQERGLFAWGTVYVSTVLIIGTFILVNTIVGVTVTNLQAVCIVSHIAMRQ